ncbi:MAG: LamG domain-containing protein [Candidatus Micrarchaeia archaeon]
MVPMQKTIPAAAIAIFLILFPAIHASYPSGLAAYWPLDSNANDALGSYNGTVTGAALNSTGKVSGSYTFSNSSSTYIDFGTSPAFNGSASFSVSAWIRPRGVSNRIILSRRDPNSPNYGWQLYIRSDATGGDLVFAIDNADGFQYANSAFNGFSSQETWYHVAATVNGSTISVYVNGQPNGSATYANSVENIATSLLAGKASFTASYFDGSIDEIAIFNRTLSASEIALYYNNSKDGVKNYFGDCRHSCPSFGFGTPTSGSSVASTSLFANVSIDSPAALKNFTFNWNGTNYSFYDDSLVAMLTYDNEPAFSGNGTRATDHSKYSNAQYLGGMIEDFDRGSYSGWNVDCGNVVSATMITGYYGPYAVRLNSTPGTNGLVCLYKSNFFNATAGDTLSYACRGSGCRVCVFNGSTCLNSDYTKSGIANWTVFTTPILYTQNSVSIYLYNNGSFGAASDYDFISQGPYFASGKYGQGLSFDGLNDFSYLANAASLENITEGSYTWGAWYYPKSLPSGIIYHESGTIICKDGYHTGLFYSSSGAFYANLWNSSNSALWVTSPLTYAVSKWYHVMISVNATSKLAILYINGAAVANGTYFGPLRDYGTTTVRIGYCYTPGQSYDYLANGTIDEVRIYNRALSASEVKQLYLSNLRKLNSTAWEFVTNQTNLTDGAYSFGAFATDTQGYADSTGIRPVTLAYNPIVSSYGGETTNFAAVADITNVTNLTLEKTGKGKIKFPATYSVNAAGADFDTQVIIGNGFISVNSSALDSSFNSTAALTMNLTGVYSSATAPTIYYYEAFASSLATIVNNGQACSAPRCTGVSWNQGTGILTFNVSGFSDYGVNGSGNYNGAGGSPSNSTGTLGINITSTNQIAVYTSNGMNDSTFSFVPVTPPAAGSITLMSNETSNTTGGELGFLVENQGNVNVSITVASDKNAASFIGGSAPLFQMFGGVDEAGACSSLDTDMQSLSISEITVCPSLDYADSQDAIWAYVLVKIDSDSPPQTSTATLTFTSTQV